MKKLILTGLSFLFALTVLLAQEINPANKAKEKVAELTEILTLNDAQQTKIYDIILEKVKAKVAIKSDSTLSPEAVKKQIKDLVATSNEKISEQLTEEQKPLFVKYLEEKEAKKQEKTK